MTINEALSTIDNLIDNDYNKETKLKWLNEIEEHIYSEIVLTHHGSHHVHFEPYTEATDGEKQLIAKDPYSSLYVSYLEAMIDYYNGETANYNNAIKVHNAQYNDYQNWYNRTHLPYGGHWRYW